MNVVDVIVIVAVLLFAWSGWQQGFVAALCSFTGFIAGGLLGSFLAPLMLRQFRITGALGLILTLGVILALAVGGQILGALGARRLNKYVTNRPMQFIDHLGGALINVLAVCVVAWILAATVTAMPASAVTSQIRSSTVLGAMDDVVPQPVRDAVSSLRGAVNGSGLPELFDTFGVLPPAPVDPPATNTVHSPVVREALNSVVRVEGAAPACSAGFTGSGFVVAPERVLTNAHVVAAVPNPHIHVPGSSEVLLGETVYFDPRIDVAIIDVPGLTATPLEMSKPVSRGDDVIIAGYPGGGPLTASAARVRGLISSDLARGTDIYGKPGVTREIYALRGVARPGNSGGPLLTTNGRVAGVVFAQAQGDPQTAYALTGDQVEHAISVGSVATQPVPVGACPTG